MNRRHFIKGIIALSALAHVQHLLPRFDESLIDSKDFHVKFFKNNFFTARRIASVQHVMNRKMVFVVGAEKSIDFDRLEVYKGNILLGKFNSRIFLQASDSLSIAVDIV